MRLGVSNNTLKLTNRGGVGALRAIFIKPRY